MWLFQQTRRLCVHWFLFLFFLNFSFICGRLSRTAISILAHIGYLRIAQDTFFFVADRLTFMVKV